MTNDINLTAVNLSILSVGRKYVSWVAWEDPQREWAESVACARYFGRVDGVDLFKGVCDLRAVRSMSAASCCEVCSSADQLRQPTDLESPELDPEDLAGRFSPDAFKCTGFAYVNGICFLKSCSGPEIGRQLARYRDPGQRQRLVVPGDQVMSGYRKNL